MLRKVIWTLLGIAGLTSVIGGATRLYLPGVWTEAKEAVVRWAGWTEKARLADPVGYLDFAASQLQRDLRELGRLRRELLVQIAEVSQKLHEQESLLAQAERFAEEFRLRYREASAAGSFPVTVRGAAYTAAQIKSQVSLLLAEAEGYRAAINRLRKVREEAEAQLEAVTVRINRTEAELVALTAQREVLKARQVFQQQADILEKVQALSDENRRVITSSPVRTVQELLASCSERTPAQIRQEAVEAFLATAQGNEEDSTNMEQAVVSSGEPTGPSSADGRRPDASPELTPSGSADTSASRPEEAREGGGQNLGPQSADVTSSAEGGTPASEDEVVPTYQPGTDQPTVPEADASDESSSEVSEEPSPRASVAGTSLPAPEQNNPSEPVGADAGQGTSEVAPKPGDSSGRARVREASRRPRQGISQTRRPDTRKPQHDAPEWPPFGQGGHVIPAGVVVPPPPAQPHRPSSGRSIIQAQF